MTYCTQTWSYSNCKLFYKRWQYQNSKQFLSIPWPIHELPTVLLLGSIQIKDMHFLPSITHLQRTDNQESHRGLESRCNHKRTSFELMARSKPLFLLKVKKIAYSTIKVQFRKREGQTYQKNINCQFTGLKSCLMATDKTDSLLQQQFLTSSGHWKNYVWAKGVKY